MTADARMTARAARVGDYEVMMKHPALEQVARTFGAPFHHNLSKEDSFAGIVVYRVGKVS